MTVSVEGPAGAGFPELVLESGDLGDEIWVENHLRSRGMTVHGGH
jgi:hypothetical protein